MVQGGMFRDTLRQGPCLNLRVFDLVLLSVNKLQVNPLTQEVRFNSTLLIEHLLQSRPSPGALQKPKT